MRALARDYFDSFQGGDGQRGRPDPGDVGPAYRSVIGLPGGRSSPLYAVFAAENTHNMSLQDGAQGDDDQFNTVWVYDSAAFPFYDGEVYHQAHCNFFMNAGMPYPSTYFSDLWEALQHDGGAYGNLWQPTGCPEDVMPHPGALCS